MEATLASPPAVGSAAITEDKSLLLNWAMKEDGRPIRESLAMLGYCHSDDVTDIAPEDLEEKERAVKSAGPNHIALRSAGGGASSEELRQIAPSADAPGIQAYPISHAWAHNACAAARRLADAAFEIGKSSMAASQAHSLW